MVEDGGTRWWQWWRFGDVGTEKRWGNLGIYEEFLSFFLFLAFTYRVLHIYMFLNVSPNFLKFTRLSVIAMSVSCHVPLSMLQRR